MDTSRHRPASAFGAVGRAITKFLRLRPSKKSRKHGLMCDSSAATLVDDQILPQSKSEDDDAKAEAQRQRRKSSEAMLAQLFAGVSSVKAAYAQLQAAQSPYDAEAIQSSDRSVVEELQAISELKLGYLNGQLCRARKSRMEAELQEVKSRVKTYELVVRKLHGQLDSKCSEVAKLETELRGSSEKSNLYQSPVTHFHFSALNPTHFVSAVREARKYIRGFAKMMAEEMIGAGWCLRSAAAAAAASPVVPDSAWDDPFHQLLAFESFVSRQLFAGFHHPTFDERPAGPRRRRPKSPAECFDEYLLVSVSVSEFGSADLGSFVRAKYLSVVHPRMDSAFFGDLGHRTSVTSGKMPESAFFSAFSDMAKRVWLLHRLAFSFDPPVTTFQAHPGRRFSQTYMESAVDGGGGWLAADRPPVVGFTASPGFQVGKTVVQCRVYPLPGLA